MKSIFVYLKHLGFTEIESKLYLILLKHQSLTVAELSKKAKLNRTAAYGHINSLLEKGVIAKVKGSSNKIIANPPEQLHFLLEQKAIQIGALQEKLPSVIATLNASFLPSIPKDKSEMKYYRGRAGAKFIYEEALNTTKLRSYVNISILNGVFPENKWVFHNAVKNNHKLELFEIFENSQAAKDAIVFQSVNKRFHCKMVPEDVALFAADTLIYDGKVAIINVGDKENITGVIISNPDYYNNSVQLFDLLWRLLPKL